MYGLVDGCAGEAHVGGVGQGFAQVGGKTLCGACAYLAFGDVAVDDEFAAQVVLAAVGFVAHADDVGTLGEQAGALGKLLYGGDEESARLAQAYLVGQCGARIEDAHRLVAEVFLGAAEEPSGLGLEVFAVYDEQDGGASELRLAAQRQLACEEQHGVGLAATGGAEVGAALAVAAHGAQVVEYVVAELARGEELRIAAHYLGGVVAVARVGEVDVVAQQFENPLGTERTAHQRAQGVEALAALVLVFYLLPFVEELEGGERRAELGLGGIAHHGEGAVFQERRYVAHIPGAYLRVGVAYGGGGCGGVLQFDDAHGYAVDEEQHVGAAVLRALHHGKLVDAAEHVARGVVEVDVFQTERIALLWREVVAVAVEVEGVLQGVVVVLPAHVAQVGHDGVHLGGRESLPCVACCEVGAQVVFYDGVGELAAEVVAVGVCPVGGLQQVHEGFLEVAFV